VRKLAAGVLALIGGLLLVSCAQVSDQATNDRAADGSAAPGGEPVLATRATGIVDGLLSVVLANTTDRTLMYADAVVQAHTADGDLVATSIDSASRTSCCAVVNLPAGQEYGLYLDVGTDADRVAGVDVTYRNVSWGAAGAAATEEPDLRADAVAVRHTADGAVVLADLTSGAAVPEAIAQAFVTDRDGRLLAVVSGRWTCLAPGTRRLHMQLFHPLPPDARVDRVVVHPVTDDPTRRAPACDTGNGAAS
jgi:hypothetical protein